MQAKMQEFSRQMRGSECPALRDGTRWWKISSWDGRGTKGVGDDLLYVSCRYDM